MLVLGTRNRKKGEELIELLAPWGIATVSLVQIPESIDIVEDGDTFTDNARAKAVRQALHLKQWVLGEDSGLEVDALKGAPGVYSARYAGESSDDEANNDKLLAELASIPLARRGARYVCHATLADPEGNVRAESEAYCRGRILFERRGTGGFGYDPLFEIVEYHQTFGELGSAVKSVLSHRSRAIEAIIPALLKWLPRS